MQLNNGQLPTHIRDWLNKRGINDQTIDAFSITYGVTGDLPNGGIHIPIFDPTGEIAFKKYRRDPLEDIKPKYLYDRGGKVTLYGAHKLVCNSKLMFVTDTEKVDLDHKLVGSVHDGIKQINNEKPRVVITEGELDTLVLWSLGIPAVSSTGGAMSFQEEWADTLKHFDVYVCFDNDDAGAKGMVKVLEYIPDAKVIFVPEIIGVNDISDFVAHNGDFHELMQTAVSYGSLEEVEGDRKRRGAQYMPVRFHDAYIDKHKKHTYQSDTGRYQGDDKVLKAKSYPCTQLLEFNRERKAVCLWHSDGDPSLYYYPKNNNCYCFACGKYADAIDIYMAQHTNMKFEDAVRELADK